MLYRWVVTADAVDDTDAAVVADVLEGAVRDERNDADESVDVRWRRADADEWRRFVESRPS